MTGRAGGRARAARRAAVESRERRGQAEGAARLANRTDDDPAWRGYQQAVAGASGRRQKAIMVAAGRREQQHDAIRREYDDAFDDAQAAYVADVDAAWAAYLAAAGVTRHRAAGGQDAAGEVAL